MRSMLGVSYLPFGADDKSILGYIIDILQKHKTELKK